MSFLNGRGDYFGILIKRGSEVIEYQPANIYDQSIAGFTGNYAYYGYLNTLGGWIIQQQNIVTGEFLYCAGAGSYSTNWGNKGSLSYVVYNLLFA